MPRDQSQPRGGKPRRSTPARPLARPHSTPDTGRPPAKLACVTARTLTFRIQIWQHFIQMPPLTPTCPVPTTISPILVMILLSDMQFNRRIPLYRQHSGVNCHVVQAVPIHWSFGPLGHPNTDDRRTEHNSLETNGCGGCHHSGRR
jgi:hypothetical protein